MPRNDAATRGADQAAAALAVRAPRLKEGSRERLLAAAASAFCDRGFLDVSAEDIATAAGVSRMTLYRHFSGKGEIAAELFRQSVEAAGPRLLDIVHLDYRHADAVREWIAGIFSGDRAHRRLLSAFLQANAAHSGFTEVGHHFIDDLVAGLGKAIPAFAVTRESDQRRYVEAWLLLYELFDQSNHAALDRGIASEPVVIDVLTDRFLRFVRVPTR